MKQMHAHAQYCWSGDHTLEGTDLAITRITAEEADDYFVVVLSDANLERYGIPAEAFGKVLTSDPRVNAFAIFIGSLGNQADRYGVVKPYDLNKIIKTEKRIFTEEKYKDSRLRKHIVGVHEKFAFCCQVMF